MSDFFYRSKRSKTTGVPSDGKIAHSENVPEDGIVEELTIPSENRENSIEQEIEELRQKNKQSLNTSVQVPASQLTTARSTVSYH